MTAAISRRPGVPPAGLSTRPEPVDFLRTSAFRPWTTSSPVARLLFLVVSAMAVFGLGACAKAPSAEASPGPATDIHDVRQLYALHVRLFDAATRDVSDAEAARHVGDANSFAWIAGHMLWSQYHTAGALGVADENPYAAQFGPGRPFDPDADYPTLAAMRRDWDAITPTVTAALGRLTARDLAGRPPFAPPTGDASLRGFLAFEQHHLAYEFGQLGLYRRILGKPALDYYP